MRTMSDETTLLPCPFCGGEVELTTYRDEGYIIKCENHDWPKAENFNPISDENIAGDIQLCSWGLGDEAKKALITAWNTRSTYGTLTAEQVREAAKSNSRQYESPVDDGVWIREYDWQAIADELNARAERTCEPTEEWCCDHCGADLIECNVGVAAGGGAYELDPPILVNYCPNCGAKVRNV